MSGSSSSTPDFTGAANQQSQSQQDLNAQQTWANRPNQNTPWGSTSWQAALGTDPATGAPITNWTQNQTLDPTLQNALGQQFGMLGNRTNIANAMMGRVAQDTSSPFNWGAMPQAGSAVGPQTTQGTQIQGGINTTGQQTNVNNPGVDTSRLSPTGAQTSVANPGQDTSRINPTGAVTGYQGVNYDTSKVQPTGQFANLANNAGQINTQGAGQTTQTTNEPGFASQRDQLFQAQMAKMLPLQQQAQAAQDTRLANMGFDPNSEAYKRQQTALTGTQSADRFNALNNATSQQQAMQSMLLGQQQQAYGQDSASRAAGNQALGQQFGQNLQGGQFANQALQNQFAQNQASQQGQNAALAAQGGQSAAQAAFANQGLQQQFGQQQASQQGQNQALQNLFGQNLQGGQFANQGLQQQFGQNQAAQQAQNAAFGQQFGQNLQGGQFTNQALQNQFGQGQQQGAFANLASGQQFNQNLQQNNQNFGQQMQASQYQNQLRQHAIAEQAQARGMSLNELNALMNGQQVASPQMPGVTPAQGGQAPNYLAAATAQGNYNTANQNNWGAGLGGIASLLGTLG